MDEKWYLQKTDNIKQLLKIRNDIELDQSIKEFSSLLIITYDFKTLDTNKISVEQMMIFFTMFENNYLEALEEENKSALLAVNIEDGLMQFYLYCKNCEQSILDVEVYLNSNEECRCTYDGYTDDEGKMIYQWV